jgi:LysR family glycine cleavage system transcriptional activator
MSSKVPLSKLRVFEAAARHRSFQAAAGELNLTPSAVSHAIRQMERFLGAVLFERSGRGIRLSPDGETLLDYVSRAFEELRRGLDLVSTQGPRILRLHSAPSFAAQWLSPRLSGFLAEHPDIEVRLAASTDYARFVNEDFDADIVYGLPRRGGLVGLPLAEETVTPLCSPALAAGIAEPADLLRQRLIESDNKQVRWPAWFARNGLTPPPPGGARFDRSFLAIAAAADGLGVALESTLLAERELGAGRLVAPLAGVAQDIRYVGHHLVFPQALHRRRTLKVFAAWLARELGVKLELPI